MKIYKRQQTAPLHFEQYDPSNLEDFPGLAPMQLEAEDASTEDEELPPPPPDPEEIRQQIMAEARAEAEQKLKEAYETGLQRGEAAARSAFEQRVQGSLEAIEAAAAQMERSREDFLSSATPQVLALARGLAEKVLRREATDDDELILRIARGALEKIGDAQQLTLRLNPQDLEVLRGEEGLLRQSFPHLREIYYQPDESITRGGCIVDTAQLRLDAQLGTLLRQACDEMEG